MLVSLLLSTLALSLVATPFITAIAALVSLVILGQATDSPQRAYAPAALMYGRTRR
jgi:hypothetical protein